MRSMTRFRRGCSSTRSLPRERPGPLRRSGRGHVRRGSRGGGGGAQVISAFHANAALQYGDRFMLKVFRLVEDGRNPELEIGRFLPRARPLWCRRAWGRSSIGERESSRARSPSSSASSRTRAAWDHARKEVGALRARPHHAPRRAAAPRRQSVDRGAIGRGDPARSHGEDGAYPAAAALLGKRTAELHLAFASSDDPAFAPSRTRLSTGGRCTSRCAISSGA